MLKALIGIILIVISIIGLFFIMMIGIDTNWYITPSDDITKIDHTLTIWPINYPTDGKRYFLPSYLRANSKPNGLCVEWRSKDKISKIDIKEISGTITSPDGKTTKMDIPYDYWYGEYCTSIDVWFAFISRGGCTDSPPPGKYKINLSYKINGTPTNLEYEYKLVEGRSLVYHRFLQWPVEICKLPSN